METLTDEPRQLAHFCCMRDCSVLVAGVHNHVVEIHEQSPEAAGPRQKPAPEAAAAPQAAANTSDDISDAQ